MTRLLNGIVAFGSALLLAVTLIGAGFAAVAIPDAATATLSRAFSGCDQPNTPFTADELASMAIAGKHYTFDDNDREKLDAAIAEANVAAEADGRATASTRENAARSLPADAISHLDDVYRVASMAKPALVIVAVLCIAGLAHVAVRIGRRALGRTLIAGGGLVLAAFCALGAWAAIDFDGLFAAFQPVLPGGNLDVSLRQPAHHLVPNRFLDGHGRHLACSYLHCQHHLHHRRTIAAQ